MENKDNIILGGWFMTLGSGFIGMVTTLFITKYPIKWYGLLITFVLGIISMSYGIIKNKDRKEVEKK